MTKTSRLLRTLIPYTTCRMNPLTLAHEKEVINPMVRIGLESRNLSKEPNMVPSLFIMGSSSESRNFNSDPLSYEQRADMGCITIARLLREELSDLLTEEELKILQKTNDISHIIDRKKVFSRYDGSSKKNTPPSLDPLVDHIVEHCKENDIPLRSLSSYVKVKPRELGREYQISARNEDGSIADVNAPTLIYKDIHQITATAQALGLKQEQILISDNASVQLMSATEVREDLSKRMSWVSPEIFKYLQQELGRASLNNRPVGIEDRRGDKIGEDQVSNFLKEELFKEKKMLNFGKDGFAEVVEVPERSLPLFESRTYTFPNASIRKSEAKKVFSDRNNEGQDLL